MNMKWKATAAIVALGMVSIMGLSGCQTASQPTAQPTTQPTTQPTEQPAASQPVQSETSDGQTAKLYIGMNEPYHVVTMEYEGDLTAEMLIEGIAEETGWNLDLYSPVTSGKGGMTVEFTSDASIFTGAPEQQKDEYFVYDQLSLVESVLSSITTTLQNNFVDVEAGGDPKSMDVYFCGPENTPISIEEISFHLPLDAPYTQVEDFVSSAQ